MALKRRKKSATISEMPEKDECEIVILVGSETGTTYDFARRFYNGLTAQEKKVYLTELNTYSAFAKAKHIIIFTATYGEGEPPTNARKLETIFPTIQQPTTVNYAVIGFGSLEYPDYCKFAIQVDALMQSRPGFQPLLPLYKINNADEADFQNWVKQIGERFNIPLTISTPTVKKRKGKTASFQVVKRTELNVDDTFLIRLKPKRKVIFTSGDLLSIFPPETDVARQYSIAKMGDEVLLSIKKHKFGKGSSYLYNLKKGDTIKAAIDTNAHFHFPKKAPSAVLIANGTGIAPFLGMMKQPRDTNINLFWGGRTKASYPIYENILDKIIVEKLNISIYKSFSREGNKQYVQELVKQRKAVVLNTIQEGGILMICGSLSMQHEVLDMLEKLLSESEAIGLDELQHNGQLRMDCY